MLSRINIHGKLEKILLYDFNANKNKMNKKTPDFFEAKIIRTGAGSGLLISGFVGIIDVV